MAEQDGEGHKVAVALPGEWILQKLLGPTLGEMGTDFQKLYIAGRDRITAAAAKKTPDLDDGQTANLRVARDVFWNGSFSEEDICAEYFGGILASSRSADGKDDGSIFYLDMIKSLSSSQLKLHYMLYWSLNKMLISSQGTTSINVAQNNEAAALKIFVAAVPMEGAGIRIDRDFEVLFRRGLISEYKVDALQVSPTRSMPYAMASATTLGVHLYALAFNKLAGWRTFPFADFGDLEGIPIPPVRAHDLEALKLAGRAAG